MSEFDDVGMNQRVSLASLRPMNLGETLDRAVQMLKSHFILFAGIAAVPALATLGHSLVVGQTFQRGSGAALAWKIAGPLLTLVFWLATVILGPLAISAKCWATSQVLLERPVTIGSAYAAFKDRKGRLVGLSLWQGLLSFWPAVPAFIILGAFTPLLHGATAQTYVWVILLLMVPCTPLYARYLLAFPATAIADSNVSDSISRSVELGRGYRWKVLWAGVLPMGIGMALTASGGALLEWLGHWQHLAAVHPFLFLLLSGLWTFATSVLYQPLASIAITLTYYDLCVRKEGFDIVQMMERAGLEPASAETEPA